MPVQPAIALSTCTRAIAGSVRPSWLTLRDPGREASCAGTAPLRKGSATTSGRRRRSMLERRHLLRAGTLAAGASLLDRARAWARTQPFEPEHGASLRLLRWSRFLEAEEHATNENIRAFTQATGVAVHVDSVWQD